MNDFKYHYLFTSFDLESFEMEDFRYNFVNITAFRLVDTNDVFVKDVFKEMEQYSKQNHIKFKKNIAVEVRMKFLGSFSSFVCGAKCILWRILEIIQNRVLPRWITSFKAQLRVDMYKFLILRFQ